MSFSTYSSRGVRHLLLRWLLLLSLLAVSIAARSISTIPVSDTAAPTRAFTSFGGNPDPRTDMGSAHGPMVHALRGSEDSIAVNPEASTTAAGDNNGNDVSQLQRGPSSDPPKSLDHLLPPSTDPDVGSCQNGTLLLPDQHAPPDPWLRWLCIKASSSSSSSFPADGKLWAQYTKVYRRLRPIFFPGKDIPKGGLVVSAKLFASGEFLSSRYFVLRECDDSKDFRGCLKQSLDFLRDVATEMDAPPKLTEKW